MSYLREVELGSSFHPFAMLRECFGFVPGAFRAQSLLPRLIEAEATLLTSLLVGQKALSRVQKEQIALLAAVANDNAYCTTLHYQILCSLGLPEAQLEQIISDHRKADLSAPDKVLLDFAIKLGTPGSLIARGDVIDCITYGWGNECVLEAVLVIAWSKFLCTVCVGLGAVPDFATIEIAGLAVPLPNTSNSTEPGPYLPMADVTPDGPALYSLLREQFGFIPSLFRIEALQHHGLEPQTCALKTILLTGDVLSRLQKLYILLATSAANRSKYWVGALCQMLCAAGVASGESEQIALDYRQAALTEPERVLLDALSVLVLQPSAFGRSHIDSLRTHGFSEHQILEAVVTASFGNLLHILQLGTGAEPDFEPPSKTMHFLPSQSHPIQQGDSGDPDLESVARVQAGDVNAFEDLIHRHSRRVYRTLVGVLGNPEEARDAMQETFLKAFQHIGEFQRRSKFSTWLVSIATNTGLQLLRERRPEQAFASDSAENESGFRPNEIRAWGDDPEQLYSKAETRTLIEQSIMKLPATYRLVLLLRDIEQLPIQEAASALGLSIAAFKARLLRGRLLLRDALTPHFAGGVKLGAA